MEKVKLRLNSFQWSLMTKLLSQVAAAAPVDGYEVESCVIGDCYKRHISQFTFFPPGKDKISVTLSMAEAFAINNFLSAHSEGYNHFIRIHLEAKLPPCKSESFM